MLTLLLLEGFKFFFYANEHLPRHIHITKGSEWARIELGTWQVSYSTFKPRELARCLSIAKELEVLFEEKWDEWFSRR